MSSVEAASTSAAPAPPANSGEESAAQKLQQLHDVDLRLASSENVKLKPAAKATPKALDTESHESFPELGAPRGKSANVAPVWEAKNITNGRGNSNSNVNGNSNGNGNGVSSSSSHTPSRSATPVVSGISSAAAPRQAAAPSMHIPGQTIETITLEPQYILPREELRRPIQDILKDINRKSRANVTMSTSTNGRLNFSAAGPQEDAQQALRNLVQQIGTKTSLGVPVPHSVRAFIIGKGGSTIKALQEKTGARITLPKADENQVVDDDDDDETSVMVQIEGNALTIAAARDAILKIVGDKAANVQIKVRGIPTAFFPFIAGPQNSLAQALEETHGVRVRVPPHQTYSSAPAPVCPGPGQRPVFAAAGPEDDHILLAGDRTAVQKVKEEIERHAAQLRRQLDAEQLAIPRGRHQFISGNLGIPAEEFFEETGCIILLPTDEDDDMVTMVGPSGRVSGAFDKATDLAFGMQMLNMDISKSHRNAPGGAALHAANITRYLRSRREIERLEKLYQTHINTPLSQDGASFWELYSRDGKNTVRAQSEILAILSGHPPSRMTTVHIDSFFHQHLRNEVTPRVKRDYGVHIVVPEAAAASSSSSSDVASAPILLVYEGADAADAYQLPRAKPTDADLAAFKRSLDEALKHIVDLIGQQEELDHEILDVPAKFHEKLRRFIKKEQESRPANQIPIRVTKVGNSITLRGPKSAVKSLAAKSLAFIEQEKQDEKERGFTLVFDFEKKFAHHLIGKGGSKIKELRDRFDVEIQVQDGKVELKGPQAKAKQAQAFIQNFGKTLADETTHVLKIDPKYHRELIGAQGNQISRLQTRYNVQINFPRSANANNAKNQGDDDAAAAAAAEVDAASEGGGKPRRQQGPDEVYIRGPKKGADQARDEIFSLHKYLEEHSVTATVLVQQKQVGSLIGQGGAALEELRQATGARIDVPADRDTDMVGIQIKGTAAQVAKAKQVLEEKRVAFDDTIVETIEVEKKHHRSLIGASGSTLREIVVAAGGSDDRRALARTIQFPKQESDGNTIKVEGRSEVVQKIVKRIREIVGERESQVTEVLEVPIDQHRSLIGRGGETKRQLETKLGVSIDVPRQGDGKTGIKLSGLPESVAKAKEHITVLLKQQQGETVQVPRKFHHAISNNGQLFRQLRGNCKVTVDHAGQAVPAKPQPPARSTQGSLPLITDDAAATSDVHSWQVVELVSTSEEGDIAWVLRGPAEGVSKAKEVIRNAVEQAGKNDATGYLVLPDPKTYRHVIGPNGSKVNAIRTQSGCRIQVPKDHGSEEAIEIVGKREGVEKAKELILAAVRDGVAKGRTE